MRLIISLIVVAIGVGMMSADKAVDEYKVIKVIGDIVYKRSGKSMSTGDVFKSDASLVFKTNNSRAAVISNLKGRFILAPPSKEQKTNLVPAVNSISSRSGAIVNALDIKNHFQGEYLIIDEVAVPVSPQTFPQDKTHFFFLSYEYNGEKIMKKLQNRGEKLVINKKSVFSIDGKPIKPFDTDVTLYYRDATSKENTKLSTFKMIVPDEEDLKQEVEVILDEYKDKSESEQFDQVKGYLTEFYGKPFDESLRNWMESFDTSEK
tara:strand:- start:10342 stop:11130 length:789 start_codon:yes stop_codon:yes gene_type:complete